MSELDTIPHRGGGQHTEYAFLYICINITNVKVSDYYKWFCCNGNHRTQFTVNEFSLHIGTHTAGKPKRPHIRCYLGGVPVFFILPSEGKTIVFNKIDIMTSKIPLLPVAMIQSYTSEIKEIPIMFKKNRVMDNMHN